MKTSDKLQIDANSQTQVAMKKVLVAKQLNEEDVENSIDEGIPVSIFKKEMVRGNLFRGFVPKEYGNQQEPMYLGIGKTLRKWKNYSEWRMKLKNNQKLFARKISKEMFR